MLTNIRCAIRRFTIGKINLNEILSGAFIASASRINLCESESKSQASIN